MRVCWEGVNGLICTELLTIKFDLKQNSIAVIILTENILKQYRQHVNLYDW